MHSFLAGRRRVWAAIRRLAKADGRTLGAIAYLTDPEILPFSEGDRLVIDASDNAIKYGQTSKKAVITLSKKIQLYSFEDLHAKVLILGNTLIAGSMNASRASQQTLAEAALITDNPGAVNAAREWLDQLMTDDALIDDIRRKRIQAIKVVQRPRPHGNGRQSRSPGSLEDYGANWYFFLTSPAKLSQHEKAELDARSEAIRRSEAIQQVGSKLSVTWIHFPEKHSTAASLKRGDHIFLGERPSERSRQITVAPYCRVVAVQRRNGRLVVHYTYPPQADNMAVSWSEFRRVADHHDIGLPERCLSRRIKNATAAAALLEAWDEKR